MDRITKDEGKIWSNGDTLWSRGEPTRRRRGDHHVRQSMARFNSKYTKLTVITCYAPMEDAPEAKRDLFYEQLQQVIQELPSHDVLCVTGDFNARVGNDNDGRDNIVGKKGGGNINGHRLFDLCEEKNFSIGGTLFQQRHKMTWRSSGGKTRPERSRHH